MIALSRFMSFAYVSLGLVLPIEASRRSVEREAAAAGVNSSGFLTQRRGHGLDDVDPREVPTVFMHLAVRPCLMHYASASGVSRLVAKLWELDFKLHVLDPNEEAGLAKAMQEYSRNFQYGLLEYFDMNRWPSEQRTLMEEEYSELDSALQGLFLSEKYTEDQVPGRFQYDDEKQKCREHVVAEVLPLFGSFRAELTESCGGRCHKFWDGCQEEDEKVCPEGTRCKCLYKGVETETRAKVAVGSFLLVWVINTIFFWGHGGWLYPGPTEAALVSLFVFASTTEGCTCTPLQCFWDAEVNACQVERQKTPEELADDINNNFMDHIKYVFRPRDYELWGHNRHISSVPMNGFKCEPYLPKTFVGMKYIEAKEPVCELRPCVMEDLVGPEHDDGVVGHIGQVGQGVYNCWQMKPQPHSRQQLPNTFFNETMIPSFSLAQEDRLKIYDKVFHIPGADDPSTREEPMSMD